MSRFANLADKQSISKVESHQVSDAVDSPNATVPPSRVGRKVISGYSAPRCRWPCIFARGGRG